MKTSIDAAVASPRFTSTLPRQHLYIFRAPAPTALISSSLLTSWRSFSFFFAVGFEVLLFQISPPRNSGHKSPGVSRGLLSNLGLLDGPIAPSGVALTTHFEWAKPLPFSELLTLLLKKF
jgi:hypothetical protein